MTQTRDRLATVKQGVAPACRSWPGVIDRSTTVPAMGERMTPCRRETGRPCSICAIVRAPTFMASSAWRAAARSASALTASVSACAASRWATPWCW